jgi:NADH:ubiquinone oxidoreductase subunit F (NADH-binding)
VVLIERLEWVKKKIFKKEREEDENGVQRMATRYRTVAVQKRRESCRSCGYCRDGTRPGVVLKARTEKEKMFSVCSQMKQQEVESKAQAEALA